MNIKEKLIESNKISYVEVRSNGLVEKNTYRDSERFNHPNKKDLNDIIEEIESYYDMQQIIGNYSSAFNLEISLGVVYNSSSLSNGQLLNNSKPINDTVHVYTEKITSYDLNGNINQFASSDFRRGDHQFYVKYNDLLTFIKSNDIETDAPVNFNELFTKINNGEKFDINLYLSLKNELEETNNKSKVRTR